MIDLQHITKTYAKNGKKAVDDLTLHVNGGELFGFIGPNGAGKTTTIKMMTGILKPDEGQITMAGHNIATERLDAQRLIGFVRLHDLAPGESRPVEFTVNPGDLEIYIEAEGRKILEPGDYLIYAGGSCLDERVCAEFSL